MALFTQADLESYLQQGELAPDSVVTVQRVVSGWLRAATQRTDDWPTPTPDDLFGWSLELAALAYNNPESLLNDTTGSSASAWDRTRRAEILAAARAAYGTAAGGAGGPIGSFPVPDIGWAPYGPVDLGWRRWWC